MPSVATSPKVFHLLPHDAWGGAETAARSAAEDPDLKCDLVVMFLAGRTLASERSRIIDNPGRKLNSPSTYVAAIRDVIKQKPDILICSLWRAVLVGLIVKLLRPSIKFVPFLHNTVPEHLLDQIIHLAAVWQADEVWADSAATLIARRTANKGTRTISFVTRLPQMRAAPILAPRFVSWSRLHRQKGHDRAIQLINQLVGRGVDARLEIWGADYGEAARLEELTRRLGLKDRIRFPGTLNPEEMPELASRQSFFLQLSRYEGMGMAVVEAMQLGLVPVVAAVGQVGRYVRDDETGIIVNPDNVAEGAERLAQLLSRPEKFSSMSNAARTTWESCSRYADDICDAAAALADSRKGDH